MTFSDDLEISRRELLTLAGKLGLGAAAAAAWPFDAIAQVPAGKDARLIARSVRPPDFETPVALLDSYLTPLDAFYVRSHMPAPAQVDEAAWRLAIDGEAGTPASLSMAATCLSSDARCVSR